MSNTVTIQLVIKRALDLAVCLGLLVLLMPLFLLIALAIKLDSPGPVIFKQMRVGQYQRRFECYKFRSMYINNDESVHEKFVIQQMMQGADELETSTHFFKMADDKRITRVGKILRKLSFDELPQIWNVIKGDMSLVGPRPAIDYELKYHDSQMFRRFMVKSGITGYWQVHSRYSVDYKKMVALDLYYVDHWSLWLDTKIVLQTVPVLLKINQSC